MKTHPGIDVARKDIAKQDAERRAAAERQAEAAIRELLTSHTNDPEILNKTPARWIKAFNELTCGNGKSIDEFMGVTFDVKHSGLVVVPGIRFVSVCEHHLLPFFGTVCVGYVPAQRVVGLSKIPRMVQRLASRLQVQERLTDEIADSMAKVLKPVACGVFIKSEHTCCTCRGVKAHGAQMVTSVMHGKLDTDPMLRAEFLELARQS